MEFKSKRGLPKIMIIPMIDIIFFLLVFFMISMLSMVHQKSLPVHLPPSETAAVVTKEHLPITIRRDGAIFMERQRIRLDGVTAALKAREKKGPLDVILNADKAVPHGVVVAVMDQIQLAGIDDITMGTE